MITLITRKEVQEGYFTHTQYIAQFVNDVILSIVERNIGLDRIAESVCPHFNDIPLKEWDNLLIKPYVNKQKWQLAGNGVNGVGNYVEEVTGRFAWSQSDSVSIAKAAARELRKIHGKPKQGRSIAVQYRPIEASSGLQSFDTFVNGSVEGVLEYYYADRGILNIGKNGEDYLVKIVGIKFHN